MTTPDHPLTETAAEEMWGAHRNALPRWRCFFDDSRADFISILRAAFDAGREHEREHADPHHDARPWQDCTRKDICAGDLVEKRTGTRLFIGVAHHQDECGEWCDEDGWLLTLRDHWPLRRIPAPTPEKDTPMTETTPAASSEPLARTLFAVPEGHGAPHHDADQIKAGDYVAQADSDGDIRHGIAHHQDKNGNWRTEDGGIVTWASYRANRPDALTVWPAPTPPAEEVELPTTDGAAIVPAGGREFFETFAGRVDKLVHLSGKWYGGSFPLRPEQIAPGTWQGADQ